MQAIMVALLALLAAKPLLKTTLFLGLIALVVAASQNAGLSLWAGLFLVIATLFLLSRQRRTP